MTTPPSQLRCATSPYTGEAYFLQAPLCKGGWLRVCGDWGIVHLWLKKQPHRHGCAVPPPPGLLRSPHEGEAFYKNVVLPPPGLLRSPHTGEAYFLQAPLCKGSSREAGEGLFSFTTPPSQLRCTTSPYTGEAFYKNVAPPPPGLLRSPHEGEAVFQVELNKKGSPMYRELSTKIKGSLV